MHGLEIEEDEPDPIGPVECPQCHKEMSRHNEQYIWCGEVLDYDAVESLQEDSGNSENPFLNLRKRLPS
jgi:hypothetical protein